MCATQAEKIRIGDRALRFRHHRDGERNLGEDGIEKAAFLDVFIWLPSVAVCARHFGVSR